MTIDIYITDPSTGRSAAVVDSEEKNALVVATRDLKQLQNRLRYFFNSDYGIELNQDASAGGTPAKVHDGTDSVLWTATDIVGGAKTTFDSTDQNHTPAGTKSVKVDNAPINDVFQFDKGSDLDASNYVSLTMWIYVDKNWALGDNIEIYGYDTGTALQVGDAVNLRNYFEYSVFDIWQKVTIPLTDMGDLASYTTLDALRVRVVNKTTLGPTFYIDDIQFEQTGTPISFDLEPEKGTWLYVNSLQIVVADDYTGTLADATMPKVPYNLLLGTTLSAGILYRRTQNNEIVTSTSIRSTADFMTFSNASITGTGSDGTNSWFSVNIKFNEVVILKYEERDKMSLTIAEDLSGLLYFRVSAGCREEIRSMT
jgi:hypothetical protein